VALARQEGRAAHQAQEVAVSGHASASWTFSGPLELACLSVFTL
jgi:hypothetical protein